LTFEFESSYDRAEIISYFISLSSAFRSFGLFM
jgi:hypothetical protein